jgi:TfoX/Sxy family transcriptional regulator of competence genes
MARSEEVDAWLARYENPMKPVVERIRAIVLAADPRIGECVKWQAPTFTYRGNLASFFPKAKQHASLMFHSGAKIPGRYPRLEGTGETGRVMKLASLAEANAAKGELERIVRAWCDLQEVAPAGKRSAKVAKPAKPGLDEALAARVRAALGDRSDVEEKRMFGGLCFMVNGQMCCGLTKSDLMVRVGKAGYDDALAQPHARPMDFTGRPLMGMVYVDPAGVRTKAALVKWVARALANVSAVAPKRRAKRRA